MNEFWLTLLNIYSKDTFTTVSSSECMELKRKKKKNTLSEIRNLVKTQAVN